LYFERYCLVCNSTKLDSNPERSNFCAYCVYQFPRNLLSCQRCAIPLDNTYQSDLTCGKCQQHPPSFDSVIASFRYEYPLNKFITAFKYKQRLDLFLCIVSVNSSVAIIKHLYWLDIYRNLSTFHY